MWTKTPTKIYSTRLFFFTNNRSTNLYLSVTCSYCQYRSSLDPWYTRHVVFTLTTTIMRKRKRKRKCRGTAPRSPSICSKCLVSPESAFHMYTAPPRAKPIRLSLLQSNRLRSDQKNRTCSLHGRIRIPLNYYHYMYHAVSKSLTMANVLLKIQSNFQK